MMLLLRFAGPIVHTMIEMLLSVLMLVQMMMMMRLVVEMQVQHIVVIVGVVDAQRLAVHLAGNDWRAQQFRLVDQSPSRDDVAIVVDGAVVVGSSRR